MPVYHYWYNPIAMVHDYILYMHTVGSSSDKNNTTESWEGITGKH